MHAGSELSARFGRILRWVRTATTEQITGDERETERVRHTETDRRGENEGER